MKTKEQLEETVERQLEWLKEKGCTFADVLEDDGGEYIHDSIEHGDQDGTGFEVETRKLYIPDFSKAVVVTGDWDGEPITRDKTFEERLKI